MKRNVTLALACLGAILCGPQTGFAMPHASVNTYEIRTADPGAPSIAKADTGGCTLSVVLTVTNDCLAGGSVNPVITGGTAPFIFIWSNGSSDSTLVNVLTGTYDLVVVDATGCGDTATAMVDITGGLSFDAAIVTYSYCNDSSGSIQTNLTGGVPPYTFLWDNGETTAGLNGLLPGSYNVTVTDANGCYNTMQFNVASTANFTVVQTVMADTCASGTGSVGLQVTGGVAPYTFEWVTGDTGAIVTGLSAGIYNVTITGSLGCVSTVETVVPEVANPQVVISVTNPGCGGDGGSVIANISNGAFPYTIIWNTGDTVGELIDISVGTYFITVTDAYGCSITDTALVTGVGTDPPVITSTVVNTGCASAIGSIDVTVADGTPPFSYNWSNGTNDEDLAGLAAGVYTVTVSDAGGCSSSSAITVSSDTCGAPAQAATQQSGNSVTISWNAVPCAFKYRLRVKQIRAFGGGWETYIVNAPDTSFTMTSLASGAIYKYRVRSQCSVNGSALSAQTPLQYFTVTGGVASCAAPTDVNISNHASTSATIGWTPVAGAYGYQVRYRQAGTVTWMPVVINDGTAASANLTGLIPNTTYQYQLRTKCNVLPFTWSAYSGVQTFATPLRLGESDPVAIAVYPNPSNGTVHFDFAGLIGVLSVFNPLGQLVQSANVARTHSIDALPDGLLTYQFVTVDGEVYSGKVVVQR